MLCTNTHTHYMQNPNRIPDGYKFLVDNRRNSEQLRPECLLPSKMRCGTPEVLHQLRDRPPDMILVLIQLEICGPPHVVQMLGPRGLRHMGGCLRTGVRPPWRPATQCTSPADTVLETRPAPEQCLLTHHFAIRSSGEGVPHSWRHHFCPKLSRHVFHNPKHIDRDLGHPIGSLSGRETAVCDHPERKLCPKGTREVHASGSANFFTRPHMTPRRRRSWSRH